jgi:hypothetical protein
VRAGPSCHFLLIRLRKKGYPIKFGLLILVVKLEL